MIREDVILEPLLECDKEQFIKDNQWAFKYGAMIEFGLRDNHFEEDGEIISRKTIETSIEEGSAYRVILEDRIVGGVVVKVQDDEGRLDLLFVNPEEHSKGVGQSVWFNLEKMFSNVKKWETYTPYFEQRNIHFYVNKCGFKMVEFFNKYHVKRSATDAIPEELSEDINEEMFRFEKIMKARKEK